MSALTGRLAEDKALRDAALELFKSDIALIRDDLDERGVGARAKDRLGAAAVSMLDDAVDYAQDNKGWMAAGAAALVLWFARKPILARIADLLDEPQPGLEPNAAEARSPAEVDSTGDEA